MKLILYIKNFMMKKILTTIFIVLVYQNSSVALGPPKPNNTKSIILRSEGVTDKFGTKGIFKVGGSGVDENGRGSFFVKIKPEEKEGSHTNISMNISLAVKFTDNVIIEDVKLKDIHIVNKSATILQYSAPKEYDRSTPGYFIMTISIRNSNHTEPVISYSPKSNTEENKDLVDIFEITYKLAKSSIKTDEATAEVVRDYKKVMFLEGIIYNYDLSLSQGRLFIKKDNGSGGSTTKQEFVRGIKISSFNNAPIALPVELSYFRAKKVDKKVLLEWETLNEINNDYFIVQKSLDIDNFRDISHKIDGKGNYSGKTYYSYIDNPESSGIIYYRLKQVDFDNSVTYSNIVPIYYKTDENQDRINIKPLEIVSIFNSMDDLYISYNSDSEKKVSINIYDVKGNLIETAIDYPKVGANTYQMKMNTDFGVFIVSLQNTEDYDNKKFSVAKN